MSDPGPQHRLVLLPGADATHGTCTCGAWARDAGLDQVVVTGRSREENLRAAHALHARAPAGA